MHYQNKGPDEAGPVLLMLVAQALHDGISPNKTPTSATVLYSKMLLKL